MNFIHNPKDFITFFFMLNHIFLDGKRKWPTKLIQSASITFTYHEANLSPHYVGAVHFSSSLQVFAKKYLDIRIALYKKYIFKMCYF